jgi:hypothetical protein
MRDESQRRPDGPEAPGASAPDMDGERRAMAAFLAARDEGAHAPVSRWRRRRRDDWRPAERRRGARPVRGALGGVLVAALLGGVAVAAGSGALPTPFGDDGSDGPGSVRPTPTSPATPGDRRTGGAPSPTDGEDTGRSAGAGTEPAKDPGEARPSGQAPNVASLCRVYLDGRDNDGAMDTTDFERLGTAAGGASEATVTAYCEGLLEQPPPRQTNRGRDDRDQRDAKDAGERTTAPEESRDGPKPSRTNSGESGGDHGENGDDPGDPGADGTNGADGADGAASD